LLHAIKKAADRHLFKETMERIGVDLPRSDCANSGAEVQEDQPGGYVIATGEVHSGHKFLGEAFSHVGHVGTNE